MLKMQNFSSAFAKYMPNNNSFERQRKHKNYHLIVTWKQPKLTRKSLFNFSWFYKCLYKENMMKDWWLMKNFETTFLMAYNSIVSTFIFCRYTNYIKIFTKYPSNIFEDNSGLSSSLAELRAAPHYRPWVNGWCAMNICT